VHDRRLVDAGRQPPGIGSVVGLSDVSTFGPYYATGAAAYEALRAALDRPDLNAFGLGYLLWTYADSRRALAAWTAAHGPAEAATHYRAVADAFVEMRALAPFPRPTLEDAARAPLAALLAGAAADEARAVAALTAELGDEPEPGHELPDGAADAAGARPTQA
jgi:hypothetical protein